MPDTPPLSSLSDALHKGTVVPLVSAQQEASSARTF